MRDTKRATGLWNLITVISVVLLCAGIIYLSGCAPTAKQTEVSPEMQKAVQDSIQKAYIFELNKAWSTGYEYYKPKIYKRAIKPFWRVVNLDTIDRFKDVYGYLSTCYFELGNPDTAQLVLEMGLKKYPDNVGLRRNLAYILEGREMVEEAIVEYEKTTQLDAEFVDDWKHLANLYIRNDQVDEAIVALQTIVKLNPSDQDAQQTLGQLLKSTGDEDAAIEALEKAHELDPENTQLMLDLAKAYDGQGEYGKAIAKFRDYLKKMPEDYIAMEHLGGSLSSNENYREAITIYKNIVAAKPDNKKVFAEIANCYRELKDFSTARSYVQKSLKVDKSYGHAYIVLGEIYEDAVDKCMRDTGRKAPKFDDKLVFLEAYRQYKKAANDQQFKDRAQNKMSYLNDFLPTKEDKFFNKNRKQANGRYSVTEKCYLWIAKTL